MKMNGRSVDQKTGPSVPFHLVQALKEVRAGRLSLEGYVQQRQTELRKEPKPATV